MSSSAETKLIYCGSNGSFICPSCYEIYFLKHELERLKNSPIENELVARGYKPGLNLEIFPYHKSGKYEDVVSFESQEVTEYYLTDRDDILGPFDNLEVAFHQYLRLSTGQI